jgi:FAD/FMN-containing dehydrogenase
MLVNTGMQPARQMRAGIIASAVEEVRHHGGDRRRIDVVGQDWAHAYYGTNYDRLRRVKATYDPDGFFRFQQSLP